MASNRTLDNELRAKFLKQITDFFLENNNEVLQTGSNEISIPCLDAEWNEKWIQIVVKVPKGGKDEDGYDGYGIAESFKIKQKEKEEKAKESQKKKAEKIKRDKEIREKNKKKSENKKESE